MNAAERVTRWSTALAVVGVAAVAAVVSYEDASDLVRAHGESGWTGRLIPLTADGRIYASSMVMLDSARRGFDPRAGAAAAGPGHCRDASRERCPRQGPRPDPRRGRRIAFAGVGRVV